MSSFKFRLLRPDEVEVRVGQMSKAGSKPWYSLLLYKDARCDMNVLDEIVGPFNWEREHYVLKDVIYCRVGIRVPTVDPETGEFSFLPTSPFVYKSDAGSESNTEKEKGESSDSFKRACFNWGIGRELYTAPRSFVFEDTDFARKRIFYVKAIKYDAAGNIVTYTVGDRRNADWQKEFKH